jgi:hypothetical protein
VPSSKLSLFVFVDAFGYAILERFPFLEGLSFHKQKLDTVFGYSATCIPSILSGKKPCEHGHFSFFYYNPTGSPFSFLRPLSLLPQSFFSRGRVRNVLSRIAKKILGYNGYFQLYAMPFQYIHLFDYSEKRDLYKPGGLNSGHQNIFDLAAERKIAFHVSDWRLSDEENFARCQEAVEQEELDFAYVYSGGLDGFLHVKGPDSPEVGPKLKYYEEKIRRLYESARKKYDEVRLFVFSDHGMHKIESVSDLMGRILARPERFGQDYVAMFDSTMIRFWFFNEQSRLSMTEYLHGLAEGKVLSNDDLKSFGTYFPDHKYGELFFLMKSHVLLCPSFLGVKPLAGMHGYHPHDKDSQAMLCTNVKLACPPDGLCDMFRIMSEEIYASSASV